MDYNKNHEKALTYVCMSENISITDNVIHKQYVFVLQKLLHTQLSVSVTTEILEFTSYISRMYVSKCDCLKYIEQKCKYMYVYLSYIHSSISHQ